MRCKTCDYPLWNLPARKCPECGTDFKPSDFQFVPNSVRFLCPHCAQDYYGTGIHGHLVPRTFQCVRCNQRIDMDEMLLLPTAGVDESQTTADVMPWLQRAQIGWFKGWIKTVGMAMVAPQRLMRAVPREGNGGTGGLGQAALFAFITNSIVAGFGVTLPLAVIAMVSAGSNSRDALEMLITAGVALVAGGVGTLITAAVWALLTHTLLCVSGPRADGPGGTMQALFYSSGANLPHAVPCIGPYCGAYFIWIWWLVSAILMVMERQKVSGLRATICVSTPPLLVVAVFAALFVWLLVSLGQMGGGWTNAGGGTVAGMYSPVSEATAVRLSLLNHAANTGGTPPAHALELVVSNALPASALVIWQVGHDEADVQLPATNMTLEQFQLLPPNRMRMAAADEAAALPTNVVAHRVGDVVFTYHGVGNLLTAPQGLWIAMIDPDPDQQPPAGAGTTTLATVAIDRSGVVTTLLPFNRASMLAQQNTLRAQNNLPPLPDPATVRSGKPAVAP